MSVIVLMATYNGAEFIEEQLNSILEQIGVNLEIYIRDDGSTDETVNILHDYESRYHNVHIINDQFIGGSAAKNFRHLILSVSNNANHYVFFADQDDRWKPEKLLNAMSLLKQGIDLYSSSLECFGPNIKRNYILRKVVNQTELDHLFQALSAGCTYGISPELYQLLRSELKSAWYVQNGFSHDWLIYTLARSNNFNIFHDNNPQVEYRQHSTNVQGSLKGLPGFLYRISNIGAKWYIGQIEHNLTLLKPNSNEFALLRGLLDRKAPIIFKLCLRLRRSKIQSFYLAAFLLLRRR